MTGPAAGEVTALLTLSAERDQWTTAGLRRERAAFRRGFTLGTAAGCMWARAEMGQRWIRIASPVAYGGPTFADLEERRWGPAGREAFGAPRAGDFQGRGKPAPEPVRTARGRCRCGRTLITFAGDQAPTCGGCHHDTVQCACGAIRRAT